MDINDAQLRQFLTEYFDGDEIHDLCFDYFPLVEQQFTDGLTKNDQIRLLLKHCRNHGEYSRLIGALQELRPGPFQQEFELAQPEPAPIQDTAAPVSRNPRQIFISYAYEDAQLAHRLAQDLQQHGWQVWIAPESIQPGEKWVAAINRGLAESGVFLLLISEHSVQARWVKSETDIAIQWEHESKMRFIPLQIGSALVANIPALWQAYQYIPFTSDYSDSLARLLAELEDRPFTLPPPAPPFWEKLLNVSKRVPGLIWGGAAVLLAVIVFLMWPQAGEGEIEPTTVAQPTEAATQLLAADTAAPTSTDQAIPAAPMETPVPEVAATTNPNEPPVNASLPDIWIRPTDDMTLVYVPGGTFTMGSSEAVIEYAFELCEQYQDEGECQRDSFADETPAHEVQVDSFWLDKHEVTNAQFAAFLNAEGNQEEGGVAWLDVVEGGALIEEAGGIFQAKVGFEDHPVIEVSWYGADAYCEWVGGALPTEAQWEYAARGEAGAIFPWGNEFEGTQLNYCDRNCEYVARDEAVDDGFPRTALIGSYGGNSWVAAQDMAGNVWEWVADWYGADYYEISPTTNPTGPETGDFKVLRGGAWDNYPFFARSVERVNVPPDYRHDRVGFRCVVSAGS